MKTAEQVEEFMNKQDFDLDKKVIRKIRVLGLFYEPEEWVEEIQHFQFFLYPIIVIIFRNAAKMLRSIGEI